MRILQVNKFFYRKGGAETYFLSLSDLLQRHQHEVIPFSMKNEKNFKSPYDSYFVKQLNIENPQLNFHSLMSIPKVLWSLEASRSVESLIKHSHPEIAHLHNIYRHISPSIIPVLKKYNIPVVMTLHDYYVVCPNYLLFNQNRLYEKTKKKRFYRLLLDKGLDNSLALSFLGMIEGYYYSFVKVWEKVDLFISPSKFLRDKMIEFGINEKKIIYIPPFIENSFLNYKKTNKKNYYLYSGRLSNEKGVKGLIEIANNYSHLHFVIAGGGPEYDELLRLAEKGKKNVTFLGHQTKEQIINLVSQAKAVIVPSLCYENAPYSVLEAQALGTVVIGSDLGGIKNLIEDNKTGLLFGVGDYGHMIQRIEELDKDPILQKEIERFARKQVEEKFSEEVHYDKLIRVYQEMIK